MIKLPAFLREPAWWTHAGATAAVILLTVFPHFTAVQQGWWDAAIAAVAGLVVAYLTHDGGFAAILGFMKAALMVMLGYHWVPFLASVGPDQQAAIFAALAALTAAYTRTQAIAPVPPAVATVGTVVPPPAPTV